MSGSVIWDGSDLAAIQILTHPLPRRQGRPAAEVDSDWNLRVLGSPVDVGQRVTVTDGGALIIG